jgi:hypothetical protein
MRLDRETIKEFQEIYKKDFGEEIDEATAREKSRQLLNLMRIIYKPTKNKDYENSKFSNN